MTALFVRLAVLINQVVASSGVTLDEGEASSVRTVNVEVDVTVPASTNISRLWYTFGEKS